MTETNPESVFNSGYLNEASHITSDSAYEQIKAAKAKTAAGWHIRKRTESNEMCLLDLVLFYKIKHMN